MRSHAIIFRVQVNLRDEKMDRRRKTGGGRRRIKLKAYPFRYCFCPLKGVPLKLQDFVLTGRFAVAVLLEVKAQRKRHATNHTR